MVHIAEIEAALFSLQSRVLRIWMPEKSGRTTLAVHLAKVASGAGPSAVVFSTQAALRSVVAGALLPSIQALALSDCDTRMKRAAYRAIVFDAPGVDITASVDLALKRTQTFYSGKVVIVGDAALRPVTDGDLFYQLSDAPMGLHPHRWAA